MSFADVTKLSDGFPAIISITQPSVDQDGSIWFDPSADKLYVYHGKFKAWIEVGGRNASHNVSMTAKPTAPTSPKDGDLWFHPVTKKLSVFALGVWEEVA